MREEGESSSSEADFALAPQHAAEVAAGHLAGHAFALEHALEELLEEGCDPEEALEYQELEAEDEEARQADTTEDVSSMFCDDGPDCDPDFHDEGDTGGDDQAVEQRRADCCELLGREGDLPSICAALHLTVRSWKVHESDTMRGLGRFNTIRGRTLAATCLLHGRTCKLWRNYGSPDSLRRLEVDMTKWFAAGISRDLAGHVALANTIKANCATRGL